MLFFFDKKLCSLTKWVYIRGTRICCSWIIPQLHTIFNLGHWIGLQNCESCDINPSNSQE